MLNVRTRPIPLATPTSTARATSSESSWQPSSPDLFIAFNSPQTMGAGADGVAPRPTNRTDSIQPAQLPVWLKANGVSEHEFFVFTQTGEASPGVMALYDQVARRGSHTAAAILSAAYKERTRFLEGALAVDDPLLLEAKQELALRTKQLREDQRAGLLRAAASAVTRARKQETKAQAAKAAGDASAQAKAESAAKQARAQAHKLAQQALQLSRGDHASLASAHELIGMLELDLGVAEQHQLLDAFVRETDKLWKQARTEGAALNLSGALAALGQLPSPPKLSSHLQKADEHFAEAERLNPELQSNPTHLYAKRSLIKTKMAAQEVLLAHGGDATAIQQAQTALALSANALFETATVRVATLHASPKLASGEAIELVALHEDQRLACGVIGRTREQLAQYTLQEAKISELWAGLGVRAASGYEQAATLKQALEAQVDRSSLARSIGVHQLVSLFVDTNSNQALALQQQLNSVLKQSDDDVALRTSLAQELRKLGPLSDALAGLCGALTDEPYSVAVKQAEHSAQLLGQQPKPIAQAMVQTLVGMSGDATAHADAMRALAYATYASATAFLATERANPNGKGSVLARASQAAAKAEVREQHDRLIEFGRKTAAAAELLTTESAALVLPLAAAQTAGADPDKATRWLLEIGSHPLVDENTLAAVALAIAKRSGTRDPYFADLPQLDPLSAFHAEQKAAGWLLGHLPNDATQAEAYARQAEEHLVDPRLLVAFATTQLKRDRAALKTQVMGAQERVDVEIKSAVHLSSAIFLWLGAQAAEGSGLRDDVTTRGEIICALKAKFESLNVEAAKSELAVAAMLDALPVSSGEALLAILRDPRVAASPTSPAGKEYRAAVDAFLSNAGLGSELDKQHFSLLASALSSASFARASGPGAIEQALQATPSPLFFGSELMRLSQASEALALGSERLRQDTGVQFTNFLSDAAFGAAIGLAAAPLMTLTGAPRLLAQLKAQSLALGGARGTVSFSAATLGEIYAGNLVAGGLVQTGRALGLKEGTLGDEIAQLAGSAFNLGALADAALVRSGVGAVGRQLAQATAFGTAMASGSELARRTALECGLSADSAESVSEAFNYLVPLGLSYRAIPSLKADADAAVQRAMDSLPAHSSAELRSSMATFAREHALVVGLAGLEPKNDAQLKAYASVLNQYLEQRFSPLSDVALPYVMGEIERAKASLQAPPRLQGSRQADDRAALPASGYFERLFRPTRPGEAIVPTLVDVVSASQLAKLKATDWAALTHNFDTRSSSAMLWFLERVASCAHPITRHAALDLMWREWARLNDQGYSPWTVARWLNPALLVDGFSPLNYPPPGHTKAVLDVADALTRANDISPYNNLLHELESVHPSDVAALEVAIDLVCRQPHLANDQDTLERILFAARDQIIADPECTAEVASAMLVQAGIAGAQSTIEIVKGIPREQRIRLSLGLLCLAKAGESLEAVRSVLEHQGLAPLVNGNDLAAFAALCRLDDGEAVSRYVGSLASHPESQLVALAALSTHLYQAGAQATVQSAMQAAQQWVAHYESDVRKNIPNPLSDFPGRALTPVVSTTRQQVVASVQDSFRKTISNTFNTSGISGLTPAAFEHSLYRAVYQHFHQLLALLPSQEPQRSAAATKLVDELMPADNVFVVGARPTLIDILLSQRVTLPDTPGVTLWVASSQTTNHLMPPATERTKGALSLISRMARAAKIQPETFAGNPVEFWVLPDALERGGVLLPWNNDVLAFARFATTAGAESVSLTASSTLGLTEGGPLDTLAHEAAHTFLEAGTPCVTGLDGKTVTFSAALDQIERHLKKTDPTASLYDYAPRAYGSTNRHELLATLVEDWFTAALSGKAPALFEQVNDGTPFVAGILYELFGDYRTLADRWQLPKPAAAELKINEAPKPTFKHQGLAQVADTQAGVAPAKLNHPVLQKGTLKLSDGRLLLKQSMTLETMNHDLLAAGWEIRPQPLSVGVFVADRKLQVGAGSILEVAGEGKRSFRAQVISVEPGGAIWVKVIPSGEETVVDFQEVQGVLEARPWQPIGTERGPSEKNPTAPSPTKAKVSWSGGRPQIARAKFDSALSNKRAVGLALKTQHTEFEVLAVRPLGFFERVKRLMAADAMITLRDLKSSQTIEVEYTETFLEGLMDVGYL